MIGGSEEGTQGNALRRNGCIYLYSSGYFHSVTGFSHTADVSPTTTSSGGGLIDKLASTVSGCVGGTPSQVDVRSRPPRHLYKERR